MIAKQTFHAWLFESSPRVSVSITLFLLTLVAALECVSPRYISFGTFYLLIIAYASWVLDRRAGWLAAVVGISASIAINGFGGYVAMASGYEKQVAMAWGLTMRLVSCGAVIELVRSFRTSFNEERQAGELDPLTGLLNRRAFRVRAARLATRSHQSGRAGVLVYADLDGFKPINDSHGHAAGDDVLAKFAAMLLGATRNTDCLGRNGGDEFVVFLDVPTIAKAERAALKIERRLNSQLTELGYDGLSCSIGAVLVAPDEPLPTIEALIARADGLMYEAKKGRFTRIERAGSAHGSR